ncbi:hypothetical protein EMN47_17620 [Prolixibacteraceae bacterium JC049]|nr:hypothetical protein [Prolixibacteraceae bacterium JC049]
MRLKLNRTALVLGLFFLTILSYAIYTQADQDDKKFILQGKVRIAKGDLTKTTVTIIKNSSETNQINTSRQGNFVLKLDFFSEYEIVFENPGHYKKKILVSTNVPPEVWNDDSDFPEFPVGVNLFEEYDFLDGSFAEKPAGKIEFNVAENDFSAVAYQSDREIKRRIDIAKIEQKTIKRESSELANLDLAEMRERKKDFTNVLDQANKLYERGEYQEALLKYQEASKLFPNEAYPKDRIAELEDLMAAMQLADSKKQEIEKQFNELVAKGDQQFNDKLFPSAKTTYLEALNIKPDNSELKNKIAETDRQILLQQEQLAYDEAIKSGDGAFNTQKYTEAKTFYQKALALRATEQYPQTKIDEIDQLLEQNALNQAYTETIAKADEAFNTKSYQDAISFYEQAIQIKADEAYPKNKIEEINQLLQQAQLEADYKELIDNADKAFDKEQLNEAKSLYTEALALKANDQYATDRIAQINSTLQEQQQLAKLEADYKTAIETADAAFKKDEFTAAIASYQQALSLKPDEAYPKEQVEKANNQLKQLADEAARQTQFNDLVAQANQAFDSNEYSQAQNLFQQALALYPNDKSAQRKLKEVNKVLDEIAEATRREEEQKRKIAEKQQRDYLAAVAKADRLFNGDKWEEAKQGYEAALTIKRDEEYPKQKITEIDSLILDRNNKLAQAEQLRIENERKVKEAQDKAYNEAITEADQLLQNEDFTTARSLYNQALTIKKDEQYPKDKITEIDRIIEERAAEAKRIADAYAAAIKSGDNLYRRKRFDEAKAKYQEALQLKPSEEYPQQQIAQIDQQLATLAEAARQDSLYQAYLNDGNSKFQNEQYAEAITAFNKALQVKPDEREPAKRIEEANAKLQEIQLAEEREKANRKAYNESVQKADLAFNQKDYTAARMGYNEALALYPEEAHPKQRITEIDAIQQAERDRIEQEYQQTMASANQLFQEQKLDEAKTAFNNALKLKPNDQTALDQIQAVNKALEERRIAQQKEQAKRKEYIDLTAQADLAFNSDRLERAAELYTQALELYPEETHPKTQLEQINTTLAERKRVEDGYNTAMATADQAEKDEDWQLAKTEYTKALSFKAQDAVAQEKLNQVNQKIEEIRIAQEQEKAKRANYDQLLAMADTQFNGQEWENAKKTYREASNLYEEEAYPKQRIREIDDIIETERQRVEKGYNDAFAEGKKLMRSEKYEEAKEQFNQALTFKPSDADALAQIRIIDQKLDEIRFAEAQEKEKRNQYNQLVNTGDSAFTATNYTASRTAYNEALTLYPNEKYPKDRISDIDRIEQELKDKEEAFQKAIASANQLASEEKYQEAINQVNEALLIKPDDTTATALRQSLSEKLNEQLMAQQQEQAKRSRYTAMIEQADGQFQAEELETAKVTYTEALKLYPSEKYPQKRITEIDKLIDKKIEEGYKAAMDEANLLAKQEKYAAAKQKYELALTFKANDVKATQKIAEMDQLIAQVKEQQAEKERIDAAFADALAAADLAFNEAKYQEAKTAYQKALELKPREEYPATQINRIDSLVNDQQEKQRIADAFRKAITEANNQFKAGQLPEAKGNYTIASELRPEEAYPKTQIAKIDSMIKAREELKFLAEQERKQQEAIEKANQKKYKQFISKADKAFKKEDYFPARDAYLSALQYVPTDTYAQNQVDKIDSLLDEMEASKARLAQQQKALQDSLLRVREMRFDSLITDAKSKILQKYFDMAIANYTEAIEIWKEKRSEVESMIEAAEQQKEQYLSSEKSYAEAIKRADSNYQQNQLEQALTLYRQALSIKPAEAYPKEKIKEISDYLKQQQTQLAQALERANAFFDDKKYQDAYNEYTKAYQIDNNNELVNKRLEELKGLIDEQRKAQIKADVDNQAYADAVQAGDRAFKAEQLVQAKMHYENALTLKANEQYPKSQIELINTQLNERKTANELAQQRKVDSVYNDAIAKADEQFKAAKYTMAKLNYQKALVVKPKEQYPTDQMNKIDQLVAQAESAANQNVDVLVAQREKTKRETAAIAQRLNKADNAGYQQAITVADRNMKLEKYPVARYHYYQALDFQPEDEYATNQINTIRKLVDGTLDSKVNDAYERNIKLADASYNKRNYSVAKHYYSQALALKNWERYPKDRLDLIENLSQSDADKKALEQYNGFIKMADEAYLKKQLAVARFYYTKASKLRSDKDYPKIKLKDIATALNQDKRDATNIEYQANITKADKAFNSKNYAIARFYYNKALRIRPNKEYPKNKIAEITKIVNEKK